ncbi:hypothetical protein [Streptomyces sp. NPDC049590]|uniref:hypothetical protein n=1 Tax=Streptomyces sp. NPDC049590 TaxID=3154834 RepID=UPI0034446FC9
MSEDPIEPVPGPANEPYVILTPVEITVTEMPAPQEPAPPERDEAVVSADAEPGGSTAASSSHSQPSELIRP